MAATILAHPRLGADTDTQARLTERLADLLAHEEILRWHAVPEAEARYWRLFGDLERGLLPAAQPGPRAPGARAARHARRRMAAAEARTAGPALPEHARRAFLAAHRRLVRRLHPSLDPRAAERAPLWAMVRRACRDGDLAQLQACEAAIESAPSPALTAAALHAALRETAARVRRLEAGFPLNLRQRMRDPRWVATRRAALARRSGAPASPDAAPGQVRRA